MILVGLLLSVMSTVVFFVLGVITNRIIQRDADPVEVSIISVLPESCESIRQKYTPSWAKFLSFLFVLTFLVGLVLVYGGIFRETSSAFWKSVLVYFTVGFVLGLRHLASGRQGGLGRCATLVAFTTVWPVFLIHR